jgi:hypothetical protein
MIAGHTHLPSDRDFAKIKKLLRIAVKLFIIHMEGYRREPFHVTAIHSEDCVELCCCDKFDWLIIKMNKSDYGNKLHFQVFAPSDSPRKEKTQCPSNTNLMKSLWKFM